MYKNCSLFYVNSINDTLHSEHIVMILIVEVNGAFDLYDLVADIPTVHANCTSLRLTK